MKESLLAIDIGNTNISIGLFHGLSIAKTWRLETRKNDASYYANELPPSFIDKKDISAIVISSVVPELNEIFEGLCLRYFNSLPVILSPTMDLGIKIWYKKTEQIGVDRLANAFGAIQLHGAPLIIIDFGTAITFDVVSSKREYLGGVIAPGLGIVRDALYEKTSLLPWVSIMRPENVLGQDTSEAVQSGIYWGNIGLVKQILEKLSLEVFNGERVTCIATGGYTSYFISDIPEIRYFDAHLTLKGLKYMYDYLKKKNDLPGPE